MEMLRKIRRQPGRARVDTVYCTKESSLLSCDWSKSKLFDIIGFNVMGLLPTGSCDCAVFKAAAMRSNLRVPAPSSTLLRFLRSQSESVAFFTANPRSLVSDNTAAQSPTSTVRCSSTVASKSTTLEAGFLPVDFMRPWRMTSAQCPGTVRNLRRIRNGGLRPAGRPLIAQRNAWTQGEWCWWRPWGHKQKTPKPLKADDTPLTSLEGAEATMFTLGRNMSAKAANEAKLRCTEFDENGNVVLVNGEFKKSELIAKVRRPPIDSRLYSADIVTTVWSSTPRPPQD